MKARSKRSSARPVSDEFLEFTSSVHFDRRLWKYDIAGSIAHVHALASAGVLTAKERDKLLSALKEIAHACRSGAVEFDSSLEDVHMNIERMLTDKVGDAGAKLHTGRSRNDQVALDLRLMAREGLTQIVKETVALQEVLLSIAQEHKKAVIPGYTHMQHAQPVLLSHHMLAHFWRLQRDVSRMSQCHERANVSPLGSGALAGTSFGIDRELPAGMLGMDGLTDNSIDAVSDRDFVAEAAFDMSLLMIHLSSLCEELILWSSQEFGYVRIPEHLSSGSSMMPQKRNPDIPELVRGKSGRTVGHLIAILTVLKSLPLAYNRDLQEDKENLFDVFDTVGASLHALTTFLSATEFDTVRMRESAGAGLMTATDLADFLVTRGVPFRNAHAIVKEIADMSEGDPGGFEKISKSVLAKNVKGMKANDLAILNLDKAVGRRDSYGGTAPKAVSAQMKKALSTAAKNRKRVDQMMIQVEALDDLVGA